MPYLKNSSCALNFKTIYLQKSPRNILKPLISQTVEVQGTINFLFLEDLGPGASFFILKDLSIGAIII